MIIAADSSVLIASLVAKDPHHEACVSVLEEYRPYVHRHALVETFSTLTGGRLGFRMSADEIARLIRESIRPWRLHLLAKHDQLLVKLIQIDAADPRVFDVENDVDRARHQNRKYDGPQPVALLLDA
ncbi:hypothetical protein HQ447_02740 [bacterium]|nr:hypothetical protein [bacterium]